MKTAAGGRPVLALIGLLVTSTLGCTTALQRPTSGHCAHADPTDWGRAASASLKVAAFQHRAMYGVGRPGKPRPFVPKPPPSDSMAAVSYPEPERFSGGPDGFERMANRSYVYDNALYVLVRTYEGEEEAARRVLQTLAALQRPDGAWGFSFNIRGDGFYNVDYLRTGAIAWVVYAMARYTRRFGDRRFVGAMRRGARWLVAQRDPVTGLFRGGSGRWVPGTGAFEASYVTDWASTEHNVDVWFTLRALAQTDRRGGWQAMVQPDGLGKAMQDVLFMANAGRYARGLQPEGLDTISALDASGTWTSIFELGRGRPEVARRLLAWIDQHHKGVQDGWQIWRPESAPVPGIWFVEGSVARAIALSRLGDVASARAMIQELTQLACVGGVPLVYANRWQPDFPKTPAMGPTAWYILAVEEVWNSQAPFLWSTELHG